MRYSKIARLTASAILLLAIASSSHAQGRIPRGEGLGKQKPVRVKPDQKGDRGGGEIKTEDRKLKVGPRPTAPGHRIDRAEQPRPQLNQRQRLRLEILRQIGLTSQQQMRLMEIRRSREDELISAGRRVRQARRALEQAIMSEHYDEALIRRRAEELAAAQAESIKLQAQVRAEVRKVLTADQVRRYNELEREFRRRQREVRQTKLQESSSQT
jgi:Spy/CpxP family protein refolding chaperone